MTNEQVMVATLCGGSVIAIGGGILLARYARRAPIQARLQGITTAGATATAEVGLGVPYSRKQGGRLSDVAQNIGAAVSARKTSMSLREQLTQAGYHQAGAAFVYIGAKILLLLFGLLGASVLFMPLGLSLTHKILCVGIVTVALFFLPNLVVGFHRSRRCNEIRKHLPDAIDLLEICCSAGMGLDQAWNSVGESVRDVSPTLADEMALTNLEMHLGASRTDAMRHMSQRTGAEELSSLVTMLIQAERFGTSIAEGLQSYATYMRETRSQRAQEAAEKMAVKLIFPMVVAIFPAVVLLMAGPAFIQLYRATKVG